METEAYIYITSLASSDLYPNNTSSAFVNAIKPLHLDPSLEYEIGLANILYPRNIYAITPDDPTSQAVITARVIRSEFNEDYTYDFYRYKPSKKILNGDINYVIETINNHIIGDIRTELKDSIRTYFPRERIITWDKTLSRVALLYNEGECPPDQLFCRFTIKFGTKLAEILGFLPDTEYILFSSPQIRQPSTGKSVYLAPYPPKKDSGIDYVIVYCDQVAPTRFGSQMVNVLDAFTLDEYRGGKHRIIYKPLLSTSIDEIAVKMLDQNGRKIYFEDNHSVTMVVHIRAK